MILTIRFGKLYKYEETYRYIYIVCLNNRQIIYIRDIRFYKEGPFDGGIDKEILLEVVFIEENDKFVFRDIISGYSKLLSF